LEFQASNGLARVWTNGNSMCDTGGLRRKMNILMGMFPRFVEDLFCVSNEHHVFNFFEVLFCNDMKVDIQLRSAAEPLDEDREPRETVVNTCRLLQMCRELCTHFLANFCAE
jgi:hypothetical protein